MKFGMISPPSRQSPNSRRDQFHQVPGGITKVNGLAPCRPLYLFLNDDTVSLQLLPPGVECLGPDAQGEMAWPFGTMTRQCVPFKVVSGTKASRTLLAHLKENVMARFFANDRQAQNRPVKGFNFLEIIHVDGGFDDGLNFQGWASLGLGGRWRG